MPAIDVYARYIPEKAGNPYRLGRHVRHDPRSWDYRVAPVATPVSKDWTRRVAIFDQGQLGSCTGNAAAGWLGTDDAAREGELTFAGKPVDEAEAVALYSAATKLDPYSGSYPPDDTGSDGLSVAKALKAAGACTSYVHAFGLADLISMLQTGPAMVGTVWYDGMFTPDATGVVSISGNVAGGHEYCVEAVDVAAQMFTFANSWGTSWGVRGYGKMTFATMSTLLADGGDATQPQPVVAPTPAPPGPTPPTPPTPAPPDPGVWAEILAVLKRILAWLEGS